MDPWIWPFGFVAVEAWRDWIEKLRRWPFGLVTVVYVGAVLVAARTRYPGQPSGNDYLATHALKPNHRIAVDDFRRPERLDSFAGSLGFYLPDAGSLAGKYVPASCVAEGKPIDAAKLLTRPDLDVPPHTEAVFYPLKDQPQLERLLDAGSWVCVVGQDELDPKKLTAKSAKVQAIVCDGPAAATDPAKCHAILAVPAADAASVIKNAKRLLPDPSEGRACP